MLNSPIDWGNNYYKGIEPTEDWKQNVLLARVLMSEHLSICSQATLNLMKLWQNYETLLFVDLPGPRKEQQVLLRFKKAQADQMSDIKTRLSANWNKEVVDILRKEMEQLNQDQHK